MEGGGWLFGEEGGTVVDHELEEAVGGAGREVGEEGGAAGGGKCAGRHLVPLAILHHLPPGGGQR